LPADGSRDGGGNRRQVAGLTEVRELLDELA
jgi:hypothetical protein